jgi:hypothetical protein
MIPELLFLSQVLTDNTTIRIKTIINKLRMVSVQTTHFTMESLILAQDER